MSTHLVGCKSGDIGAFGPTCRVRPACRPGRQLARPGGAAGRHGPSPRRSPSRNAPARGALPAAADRRHDGRADRLQHDAARHDCQRAACRDGTARRRQRGRTPARAEAQTGGPRHADRVAAARRDGRNRHLNAAGHPYGRSRTHRPFNPRYRPARAVGNRRHGFERDRGQPRPARIAARRAAGRCLAICQRRLRPRCLAVPGPPERRSARSFCRSERR